MMEIIPFTSVGILRFGDLRDTVRARLGTSFTTFQKVPGENETDSFDSLGLHLYYDSGDRLEFIEAFSPAKITFREISFLGRQLQALVSELQTLGFAATQSDVGVKFGGLGVALTAPYGVIEGVAAYRRGYYDRK